MYLKRLDVQGFKSFANRTQLEFTPGVTCVIGPNGTGKTNVADSLRWVLGEHASRQLRARKTEDVIFAGSDKRAPMGVAEVSIALDNSAHWLPIDFDEVVVTRRAYRSGDNEYLINSARVRLRDVVELFQRAQVGQNSYAFMGQGMVEQALSLRPEDRRALIEEAADVRIYRNKLEDARNKLKATRENVDRVRMLVREIEPRIAQLERQAGRAVKYQELTRELAATLHIWFSHQWREVNDQLLAAITTQDQRAEELEHVRAEAKACDEALAQLRTAIDERKAEISGREGRLSRLQDYARDLERRTALDGERARMLTERVAELAAELETLRAEEASQQVAAPLPDNTELQAQLETERAELQQQRARLTAVEQEFAELQQRALINQHAATRARAVGEDAARRITEAVDAVARLRREREGALESRRKIVHDLAGWAKEYARALAEGVTATASLAQAQADRERAAELLVSARAERERVDAELRQARAEFDQARLRLELVEQMDVRPQAPDAGVRLILEAGAVIKRESVPEGVELTGVRGLLGTLLRVPPCLERAIEAALADNLFAIVFERETDLRAAVALLLEGDRGRATMYALDNFSESRPLNLIKEKGVLGVASTLVKCDGRYRRLVDTLLGRVVVVENVPLAQRFVRRGLAAAVATTGGVLLRPVGSVSAGTMAMVEAGMAHDRELSELPETVARLQPAIEQREQALADAAQRIDTAEQRVRELERTIETLRDRRARHDARLASETGRLAAYRARFQSHADATARRTAELDRLADVRTRLEAERDAQTRDALAAEESEQGARRAIAELEAARAQLTDAIAERAATVARLDGELRADRAVTGADRMSRERLARQIAGKDEQRQRLMTDAQEIAARLETDGRELAAKNGEIEALLQELEPARQELAQFESRDRTLAAEMMEANARLRESDRALVDAANDVRIREEELESLRVSLETEGFIATSDGEVERAPQPAVESSEDADAVHAGNAQEAGQPGDLPGWLRAPDGESGLPPIAGGSTLSPLEVRDRIAELRGQIRGLGPVNEQAASDYTESRERYDFLTTQMRDLSEAEAQLLDAVDELERVIREKFRETFKVVNREFERYFNAFFRGGSARLEIGETDDDGLPGVDIVAQPPGKKLGSLALLSGGERSLTAVALLFALLQANPSPICVLDEVDAALDEANVGRFVDELRALSARTQFIIITHNRRTIENADTIYGVSMGADSVTKVLSLKLEDVKHVD